MKHFWLVLFFLCAAGRAVASEPFTLSLEAYCSEKTPVLAVLTLTPAPGWHAYGNVPGPSGFPTVASGSQDGAPMTTLYPRPTPGPDPLDPSLTVELYEGQTPFFLPASPGANVTVDINALLCSSTTCQPIRATRTLTIADKLPKAEDQSWWPRFLDARPARDADQSENPVTTQPEAASGHKGQHFSPRFFSPDLEVRTLSKAAALAFLAGLILNFMPCVLPVITLKLRSFVPVVGSVPTERRQTFRAHNLFFALGMMLYFLLLAILIAATGMVWGQIFQQPGAIIALTAVVFALSLSLFGLYDLPLIDLKGKSAASHPRLESFTTGILATILATPCSGPFLGGVLAWALIQPVEIIALVLSCIGLGMASPYLIMAAFPQLYRFLPRPGAWTRHLERILGFLLAGTCVYLIGLLPTSAYLSTLILLWVIALAAWIWGQPDLNQTASRRWSIRSVGVMLVVGAALLLFRPQTHVDPWQPFSMSQFENALGREHLILDFTADWCPNCKFLEKTVLDPEKSAKLAERFNVRLLRVDLTRHDPELMALLDSLGSKSIPILAIFSRENSQRPLVLRDLFTGGQLEEALQKELGR